MRKKRILIVEDEIITAMDEQGCLESLGYEVISIVTSGEEAIKLTETERPDLVLMDITLEGEMDGIEAGRKIRNTFNIPVIFVTAIASLSIRAAAEFYGFSGFITKPYSRENIKENVETVFNGSH